MDPQMVADLAERVLGDARRNATGGHNTLHDSVMGFYHAVDWSERWLQGLLLFHATLFLAAFLTRRVLPVQGGIFVGACALVYFAERINAACHARWQSFATQDYFDPRGVFAGVVFSAPLLAVVAFQMLYNLYAASNLLVAVKRAELQRGIRNKKKVGEGEGDAGDAGDAGWGGGEGDGGAEVDGEGERGKKGAKKGSKKTRSSQNKEKNA